MRVVARAWTPTFDDIREEEPQVPRRVFTLGKK